MLVLALPFATNTLKVNLEGAFATYYFSPWHIAK